MKPGLYVLFNLFINVKRLHGNELILYLNNLILHMDVPILML